MSTFLATHLGESGTSLLYLIAALITLIAFFFVPKRLGRHGNWKVTLTLGLIELVAFLGLIIAEHPAEVAVYSLVFLIVSVLISFNLDIFLEGIIAEDEHKTGSVRGLYLSLANAAYVIAPVITGWLVGNDVFENAFFVAMLLLGPFLVILALGFKRFTDPIYEAPSIIPMVRQLREHIAVRRITLVQFMLRIFYALAIVYLPLYMHEHIGFSWGVIGLMFSVSLIPYALFEFPAGRIADRLLGEKELLGIGVILLAGTTVAVATLGKGDVALWYGILFLMNTGASLIEIASESYFFKHVNGKNINAISLFRMAGPAGRLAAVAVGAFFLLFADMRYLFIVFGLLFLYALVEVVKLKDTK